jgi:hypothetical protein
LRVSGLALIPRAPARASLLPPAARQVGFTPSHGSAVAPRCRTIESILQHDPRSADRAEALAAAAAEHECDERTIYRWLELYQTHGVAGLVRKRPTNAGEQRVVVSQAFDPAIRQAGYSDDVLARIGHGVEQSLKGLWASRAANAGWNEIRRLAEFMLLEACRVEGVSVAAPALRLSRRQVERFAHFRVVNQRRNDRKAFDDAKPRIKRDWTGLAPMERIVADVKHLDVIVQRPDASPAWPKMIAFLDAGTARVFEHLVLLDPGEGVRQEHVITAFLAMVSDPHWGFPAGLYLDNGPEFGGLTKIAGALQLMNDAPIPNLVDAGRPSVRRPAQL